MLVLVALMTLGEAGVGALQSESPIRMRPLQTFRSEGSDASTSNVTLRAEAEHRLLVEGDGRLELALRSDPEELELRSVNIQLSPPEGMSTAPTNERTESDGTRALGFDVSGWPLGGVLDALVHYLACDASESCVPHAETFRIRRVLDASRDDGRSALSRREGRNGPTGMTRRLMELDTDEDGRLSLLEIPEHMEALRQSFERLDRNADGFVDARELEEMTRPDFRRRR